MSQELQIAGNTGMLPYRERDGQKVFTFADIAAGLGVDPVRVRNAYSRHTDAWDQAETWVYQFETPHGTQSVRHFTARGAMRFSRFVKSGRSDALFNHLLNLWEAERVGALIPAPVLSEVDKLAMVLGVKLPEIQQVIIQTREAVLVVEDRLVAVEARQADTDPVKIEEMMAALHSIKEDMIEGTKGQMVPITYRAFWTACCKHISVASFKNRAGLTVEKMDKAIGFARAWCFSRGVAPDATLFDRTPVPVE